MSLRFNFFFTFLLIFFLVGGASAQQVTFNDLNLVDRDVSIYAVNDTGTYLVSSAGSSTANTTLDLSQDYSYQVVIEPSHNTWFDNPQNAIQYFFSDSAGQTLTFIVFALALGGFVKIVFR